MDVYQDQPARSLGNHEFLEDGGQFGIGAAVDAELQPIHGNVVKYSDDGGAPAHHLVPDTEDDGTAATVGHAHGCGDCRADGLVIAAAIPLLEVEILVLEVVGRVVIEPVEELLDVTAGSGHGRQLSAPSPTAISTSRAAPFAARV